MKKARSKRARASYKADSRRLGKEKARGRKLARISHRRTHGFRKPSRRGILYVS